MPDQPKHPHRKTRELISEALRRIEFVQAEQREQRALLEKILAAVTPKTAPTVSLRLTLGKPVAQ